MTNGTEDINEIFLGHLSRLVHDERLVHRWVSDTVLPLINHALATSPNTELGGLNPAELKFGTKNFPLPPPIVPGNIYRELVQQLDNNLAIVCSVTSTHQAALRDARLSKTPHNHYQPGDLILWNPREHAHSFLTSKLAPKLLGPYVIKFQNVNDITCEHTTLRSTHGFHSDRVTPFISSPDSITDLGNLDRDKYIVASILAHRGNALILWSSSCTGKDMLVILIPGNHGVFSDLSLHCILTSEYIVLKHTSRVHTGTRLLDQPQVYH